MITSVSMLNFKGLQVESQLVPLETLMHQKDKTREAYFVMLEMLRVLKKVSFSNISKINCVLKLME